jgi:hypothetical protein
MFCLQLETFPTRLRFSATRRDPRRFTPQVSVSENRDSRKLGAYLLILMNDYTKLGSSAVRVGYMTVENTGQCYKGV